MRNNVSALITTLAVVGTGCAASYPLTTSNNATATNTRGKASITVADNGNTQVKVCVKHLDTPDKVAAAATTYVVWATPDGDTGTTNAINLGALYVDKDMKGELMAQTSMRSFTLSVTPETNATAATAAGPVMLSAHIIRK